MRRDPNKVSRKEENQVIREHFQVESNKLAQNIKNIRLAHEETQDDLAIAINVTKSTISQYENQKRTPYLYELMAIAHHYKLSIERLIYGDYSTKFLDDEIYVYEERTKKLLWETLFEMVVTDQALKNEHFRKAYKYHFEIHRELCSDSGNPNLDNIPKCQELYQLAAKDGVVEAVVNQLWFPMFFVVAISSQVCRLRKNDVYSINNQKMPPVSKLIKTDTLPSVDDLDDTELYEHKYEAIKDFRLEIYSLIRTLKQSDVTKYRHLADYYIALLYRHDCMTDSLSPEESYAIGSELLTLGRIMENPYAERYLQTFDQFCAYYDDEAEDEDN